MIQPVKLFDNIFESTEITSTRLANFADDCLNRITAANANGEFTDMIKLLTKPAKAMDSLIADVDTSLNIQKGKTKTLDQMIVMFKLTMSEQEGVIANAVGGFSSGAYTEFYPQGVSEYTAATKTNLPVLLKRVAAAAGTYSVQLGDKLTATLQAFENDWELNRGQQEQQKGNVDNNRTESTQAREDLETALITVVHTIAGMFPGDAEKCMSFFSFQLLKRIAPKAEKEIIVGDVIPGKTSVALNRELSEETKARITNKSDAASIYAYLGADATASLNGRGVEIKAGKSRNVSIADLGDMNNTFLLIHNLSEVNDAGFQVEIKN